MNQVYKFLLAIVVIATTSSTNGKIARGQDLNPFDPNSDVRKSLDSLDNFSFKNPAKFRGQAGPARPYVLVNVATGKLLDLPLVYGNPDGVRLHAWAFNGQRNQQWFIYHGDDGTRILQNVMQGKFLDLAIVRGNPNGAVIHGFGDNGQRNQKWIIEPTARGTFRLRNAMLGKYMQVMQLPGNADGASIAGWDPTGQLNQEWQLFPAN